MLQNYLMLPLKDEDWVDIDSFLQSIEAIHMTSLDKNSFFYKEPSSSHKKNLTMQKLLCNPHLVFYKLLEFCDSSELRKEKLQIVISMGLKKLKKPINNLKLTDWILEKSNSNLENKKDTINFEDFFCIMKN